MTILLQDAAADSESDRKVKSHRRGVGSLEYAAVDAHRILVDRVGTGGKGEGRAMRNYRSWKLVDKLLGSREETWLLKSRAEVSRDPASRAGKIMFLETSALTGENVEEAFLKCSRSILTKIESGELDPDRMGSGIQYGDASLRRITRQPQQQRNPHCTCG
ncbi:RAB4A [Branchiostoma lanceolatum]|uniref:RAB4A protein n=1 Tax=Branchiostoma lanceolatum TaxID=7740 RepID=A0A8J9ZV17_BRALA|nr:RAB4A [Branchiostoma lanceolatum]